MRYLEVRLYKQKNNFHVGSCMDVANGYQNMFIMNDA